MATEGESATSEKKSNQDLLREFLADREIGCPDCGYNLRSQTGDICPECGNRIQLQLSVDPKQTAPLAGLIGLSAGAGFNLSLLFYVAIQYARFSTESPVWTKFLAINSCGFLVTGLCIFMWLRRWRRIRRFRSAFRWILVIACWVLTMIDVIVFSFAIR